MEVSFPPDLQSQLDQLSRDTGRPSGELIQEAVISYFDELAQTRAMLDCRFDDLAGGHVTPMDGEEAFQRLLTHNAIEHAR
ncbi:MAG: hypothetical protein NTV70_25095 [Acidobacteria bacterium]|nr:hypothetical protein [Acidobacteriota bacterium]